MKVHPAIDMVTVSADLVPDLPSHPSMLAKSGLQFRGELDFKRGIVERLNSKSIGWQGDIPRQMLISREGTITTIERAAEIADLNKWSDQQRSVTK